MDNLESIKEYISTNKDKLNLSFNESIIREDISSQAKSKVKFSDNINEKSYYPIIPFYKKITRFI